MQIGSYKSFGEIADRDLASITITDLDMEALAGKFGIVALLSKFKDSLKTKQHPSQKLIEKARILNDGDMDHVRALEASCETIARKLFPELNWDARPVVFKISNDTTVNAEINLNENPPIIVLTKGLVAFVENEDELAYTIGHEMGHKSLRKKLGLEALDVVTKTEESLCDIISVLACVKAGYSYKAASNMFRRLEEKIAGNNKGRKDVLGDYASAAFDPHPGEGNRVAAIELALANENLFKSGTVRDVPYTRLSGAPADKAALDRLAHRNFLDTFLPADYDGLPPAQKITCLKSAIEKSIEEGLFESVTDERPKIIATALYALPADDAEDPEARKAIDTLIDLSYLRCKTAVADHLYFGAARHFHDDHIAYFRGGLPALGPFKTFGESVDAFLASTPETRAERARHLVGTIQYLRHSIIEPTPVDSFSKPGGVFSSLAAHRKLSAIALKTYYPEARDSKELAAALWQLGAAFDKDFWDVIGDETLAELRNIEPVLKTDLWGAGERDRLRNDIETRIQSRQRAAAQAEIVSFLANPPKFLFAYDEELFPKGNPLQPRPRIESAAERKGTFYDLPYKNPRKAPANDVRIRQEFLSKKIADEVMSALRDGDERERQRALAALHMLFGSGERRVSSWLLRNGGEDKNTFDESDMTHLTREQRAAESGHSGIFNSLRESFDRTKEHYSPYKLGSDHPFVRLLIDALPYLNDEDRKEFVCELQKLTNITAFDDITLLKALGHEPPQNLRQALAFYYNIQDVYKTVGRTSLPVHITCLTLERFLTEGGDLAIDDPEFLALTSLHRQNPQKRISIVSSALLTPDSIAALGRMLPPATAPEALDAAVSRLSAAQLTDVYQFLEDYNLFPHEQARRAICNSLQEKIMALPESDRAYILGRLMVDQTPDGAYGRNRYTVKDIHLRNFCIPLYARVLRDTFGPDDGTQAYAERVKPALDNIIAGSHLRDRTKILQEVATTLNIQEYLSGHIAQKLELGKEDIMNTSLQAIGLDIMLRKVERDPDFRHALIDYFSDPFSAASRDKLADVITRDEGLVKGMTRVNYLKVENERVVLDDLARCRMNQALYEMHENFHSLSIELKAGILSVLLVPGQHRLDEDLKKKSYEEALKKTFAKVFHSDMAQVDEARSFMAAFLDSAHDFERPALLAALMALSSGGQGDHKTLPEKAAEIMTLLGPAHVKFGQAINSHPDTPPDWRAATARLKSQSEIEYRWETILRTRDLMKHEDSAAIIHYGPVMGAASFNTGMEVAAKLGAGNGPEDMVALLERPHAWSRAEAGFSHMDRAIAAWNHPFAAAHRNTLQDMIWEAVDVARTETNREAGNVQYQRAQDVYQDVRIEPASGTGPAVIVNPVKCHMSVPQLRLISRADGTHFEELPESTPAELAFKKTAAKANLVLEFSNILSGDGFDCDRHGRQEKVLARDDGTIMLNIYDYGGLDLETPSPAAKKALGQTLDLIVIGLQNGQNAAEILHQAVLAAPDDETRRYLGRTRKAWLALQDFQRYVDAADMIDVLKAVADDYIDPEIREGFSAAAALENFTGSPQGLKIVRDRRITASPSPSPGEPAPAPVVV